MLTALLIAIAVTLFDLAVWSWCAAAGRADAASDHLWTED